MSRNAKVAIVGCLLVLGGFSPLTSLAQSAPAEPDRKPVKVDVGPVPTPDHIVELMLTLAKVQQDDVVYDLGCGDGRIVVAAAKKYGCRAVGFDIDPECIQEARLKVQNEQLESLVSIKNQDIFELDLSEVDVVTLYLLERLNEKLLPQLEKMKPGSRIVSHDFPIPGVPADIEIQCYSRLHSMRDKIYVWTTPLKRSVVEVDDDEGVATLARQKLLSSPQGQAVFGLLCFVVFAAVVIGAAQKLYGQKLTIRFERYPSQ